MTADWRERLARYRDPDRPRGEVVFRIPEDLDALIADYDAAVAAVRLLRAEAERERGTWWRAGAVARATARWGE